METWYGEECIFDNISLKTVAVARQVEVESTGATRLCSQKYTFCTKLVARVGSVNS